MANAPDKIELYNEDQMYYTASDSAYLQGAEIVQMRQLLQFTNVKIRSNTSLALSTSGSIPGYTSLGTGDSPFNDTVVPSNFGHLSVFQKSVYTAGGSAISTGRRQTVILENESSNVFDNSSDPDLRSSFSIDSSKSQAFISSPNELNTYVSHIREKRDLGQSVSYDDGLYFYEPDNVDKDSKIFLNKDPENIIVPTSLVQATSLSEMDGSIEVFTIRSEIDRSSIEMPFIARSVKGSLAIVDDKRNSRLFMDEFDLRQRGYNYETAPYLDSVETFGAPDALLDQPGAFSDSPETEFYFIDRTENEQDFPAGVLDSSMRSFYLAGVLSGAVTKYPPDLRGFPTYLVAARHGFVFSQNDNFGYDSIAFGGWKK